MSEGPAFVAWFWQCWAVSWDVIKTLRTGCLLHGKGVLDGAGIWGCQFGQGIDGKLRTEILPFIYTLYVQCVRLAKLTYNLEAGVYEPAQ